MMEHARLNFHPLRNTMTTTIARDDLVRFLDRDRPSAADRAGLADGAQAAEAIAIGSTDTI